MDRKLTVLLVDDDKIFTYLSKVELEAFEEIGQIDTFTNCLEALEYLQQICHNSDGDQPLHDIIFVDIQLAYMDGFEFIEKTRQLCKDLEKAARICFITNSSHPRDLQKAEEHGIPCYYNKPLAPPDIRTVINQVKGR